MRTRLRSLCSAQISAHRGTYFTTKASQFVWNLYEIWKGGSETRQGKKAEIHPNGLFSAAPSKRMLIRRPSESKWRVRVVVGFSLNINGGGTLLSELRESKRRAFLMAVITFKRMTLPVCRPLFLFHIYTVAM